MEHTSQGTRLWAMPSVRAGVFFLVPLLLTLILPIVTRVPEYWLHLLLTVTAVMGVHLLDRAGVIGDFEHALDYVRGHLESSTKQQLGRLLEPLHDVQQNINGVQAKITEQTDTLVKAASSLDAMMRSSIQRLYESRRAAAEDITREAIEPATSKIRLIGISLNDFAAAGAPLNKAWKELERRIRSGAQAESPSPLDVKILIVDPECFGAQLREVGENREAGAVKGRLEADVIATAKLLRNLQRDVAAISKSKQVTFECKVYRLPPILFLCLTDSCAYVQQYYFWATRDSDTSIPVLRYGRTAGDQAGGVYKGMEDHFDWIWKNCAVSVDDFVAGTEVGTDRAVYQADIFNMFNGDGVGRKRILQLIRCAKKRIFVQGITLHSFFAPGDLLNEMSKAVERGVDVRVLVLDPDSEQAVYRSYREQLFVDETLDFRGYRTSGLHQSSQLWRDTDQSLKQMRTVFVEPPTNFQARLYASAPSCFMLLADDALLFEPYHYGKVLPRDHHGGAPVILGKDMPLFEFRSVGDSVEDRPFYRDHDVDDGATEVLRDPFRLLENHFRFVFEKESRPATIHDGVPRVPFGGRSGPDHDGPEVGPA